MAMKRLACTVSREKMHVDCAIVRDVVQRVDEVLAGLETVDLWNSTWGQDHCSEKNNRDGVRMWQSEAKFEVESVYLQYPARKNSIN